MASPMNDIPDDEWPALQFSHVRDDPHRLIMFSLDPEVSRRMAWSWDPAIKDLADQLRDAN